MDVPHKALIMLNAGAIIVCVEGKRLRSCHRATNARADRPTLCSGLTVNGQTKSSLLVGVTDGL